MKYCCDGFKDAFKNIEKRGFSIFATEDNFNKPIFYLYFRSIDMDEENELKSLLYNVKFQKAFTLSTECVISYCPWCGKNLARFYDKTWKNILGESLT